MTSCPDAASAGIRLPNLFCAGAVRAGTTFLYERLAGHPEVYMSPVKEPNYFARADGPPWMDGLDTDELRRYLQGPMPPAHNALVADWDDYLALFGGAGAEPVVGEASPSYLYSERAPGEIAAACPDARVVLSLRHPVERARSHHGMDVAIGATSQGFAEALGRAPDPDHPYVAGSLYSAPLERYLDAVGADRLRVYLFEELEADPVETLRDLAGFLGIDPSGFPSGGRANPGLAPRARRLNVLLERTGVKGLVRRMLPERVLATGKRLYYGPDDDRAVPPELADRLRALFRPDVERLEELLGRDLSHWLEAGRVSP